MKILLVNAPCFDELISNDPNITRYNSGILPPLGLLYMASYLRDRGYDVRVHDSQIEQNSYTELSAKVEEFNPDVIGMTVMTFTLIGCKKTMDYLRLYFPKIPVVLGGPHPTIYPEETLKYFGCDYVVVGEGEIIFEKLLRNLPSDQKIWRAEHFIENLDELQFPARDLVPYKKYSCLLSREGPTTSMFSSRGCPFQCYYCDRPALGKRFRAMSAKRVVEEMAVCQKMGIKEIFFYDDTFTVSKKRVMDICSLINERFLKISWDIRSRVDTVDEEMIKAMKGAGCVRIHFGVESGVEAILKNLNKGIHKFQATNAINWCKKYGIMTLVYFMIGNPGETDEDIEESIKFAKELNPDHMQCHVFTPFPATESYRQALRLGNIKTDVWREYSLNPTKEFESPVWSEKFSREELNTRLNRFFTRFYLTPQYILKCLLEIRSFKQLKKYIKLGMDILKLR